MQRRVNLPISIHVSVTFTEEPSDGDGRALIQTHWHLDLRREEHPICDLAKFCKLFV
jgi:hypothetical protein